MVKQWKKSLEQSDILSDGTPFDGANIDQPISQAGGNSFDEVIDTSISQNATITINNAGEFQGQAQAGNWSPDAIYWQIFIDDQGSWGRFERTDGGGTVTTPQSVLSSGDGDVRLTNDQFERSVRVVRKS